MVSGLREMPSEIIYEVILLRVLGGIDVPNILSWRGGLGDSLYPNTKGFAVHVSLCGSFQRRDLYWVKLERFFICHRRLGRRSSQRNFFIVFRRYNNR